MDIEAFRLPDPIAAAQNIGAVLGHVFTPREDAPQGLASPNIITVPIEEVMIDRHTVIRRKGAATPDGWCPHYHGFSGLTVEEHRDYLVPLVKGDTYIEVIAARAEEFALPFTRVENMRSTYDLVRHGMGQPESVRMQLMDAVASGRHGAHWWQKFDLPISWYPFAFEKVSNEEIARVDTTGLDSVYDPHPDAYRKSHLRPAYKRTRKNMVKSGRFVTPVTREVLKREGALRRRTVISSFSAGTAMLSVALCEYPDIATAAIMAGVPYIDDDESQLRCSLPAHFIKGKDDSAVQAVGLEKSRIRRDLRAAFAGGVTMTECEGGHVVTGEVARHMLAAVRGELYRGRTAIRVPAIP